jgi:hypothetical protein
MRLRDHIVQQIIGHLKASILDLEETLQSEKASLYGETKSSAGDKYETQREMIQGEIQRTKTQWSLKNEQLESLYTLIAWEQNMMERFATPSMQNPNSSHPFEFIRNGSIVHLIPLNSSNNNSTKSAPSPNSHPPKENDKNYLKTDGMWLFIGASLGDIRISAPKEDSISTDTLLFKTLTTESPLGKVIMGKKSGDSFHLNGKSFSILNCF